MEWWKNSQPKRRSLLLFGVIIWLSGYWFFPNGWWHRHLLKFLVLVPLFLNLDSVLPTIRENKVLCLTTLSALFYAIMTREWHDIGLFFSLILSVAATAQTSGKRMGTLLIAYFLIGTITTIWSLIDFYFLHKQPGFLLVRFQNTLVYENGLHPVITGMLCGLALIAGLACKTPKKNASKWITYIGMTALTFAILAANTRGAILATGCAGLVLLIWKKQHILWQPSMVGILIYIAACQTSLSPPKGGGMLERGTTGRTAIYKTYVDDMKPTDKWVGKGSLKLLYKDYKGWVADHPHSSYLTLYWQNGIIGCLLLAATLTTATWQGMKHWSQSHLAKAWLALLAFGLSALIFDGGQLYILNSSARIEPLFLIIPAILLGSLKMSDPPTPAT